MLHLSLKIAYAFSVILLFTSCSEQWRNGHNYISINNNSPLKFYYDLCTADYPDSSVIIPRDLKFVDANMEIYQNNEEPVFKIDKIVLCSSANAIDRSIEQNLQDLSIYQYTDIAVYIDNGDELSNKNTVSKLYIDNISLEGVDTIGQKSLRYKNLLNFGLKEELTENVETKDIEFNIIYTNEENELADYDHANFYTDCSNPITLEYLNYNLVNGYKMDENNSVDFDGSILEKAGVSIEDINCKVKFKINIINNQNEKYSCWVNFQIPLEDIYEGTTMKAAQTIEGNKYIFFRE